jgi:hypothetical protein
VSTTIGPGDAPVRCHAQREPGVVVDPGQDLDVGAGTAVGSGQPVMGEVGLPALVGLLGGETDVGALRLLLRLGDHQACGGEVAADRRRSDGGVVVVLQMPGDGVRAGIQTGVGQFLAQPHDQLHHRRRGGRR